MDRDGVLVIPALQFARGPLPGFRRSGCGRLARRQLCGSAEPYIWTSVAIMGTFIRYRRLHPGSPIRFYENGPGYIRVVFAHQRELIAYRYTERTTSPAAIAEMQELAGKGRGLGTYIARNFGGDEGAYDEKRVVREFSGR
jgi:hypothetical protein